LIRSRTGRSHWLGERNRMPLRRVPSDDHDG
jgi:hypothetical protein